MADNASYDSPAEPSRASCQLHGVLVHVFGNGVLLTGDPGIGKTACAIELMRRGHQLIADDAVKIFRVGEIFYGRAPELTRSLLHIRGVGICSATDVFDCD